MCMAFPCSDYYESSVLDLVHIRSSRLAQFRVGQTSRVPVFRSSTFVPLGSELYPLQLWRWAEESRSHLECDGRIHQRGTSSRASSVRVTLPPTPSRDLEVVLDKYRGFSRPLRYLAIDTAVARPGDDGLHPVQLRPICLCHPTGDTRSSFSAPFHLSLSDRGAALQPPVEDQQSLRGRSYFILNLPRLHGAHSPCSGR